VLTLSFKDGLWTLEGERQETRLPLRTKILEVLAKADRPLGAKDVAEKLGMGDKRQRTNVRQALKRMTQDGQITRLSNGAYILPNHSSHSVTEGMSLLPMTETLPAVSQVELLANKREYEGNTPSVTGVPSILNQST
jgi:DNA-binding GntR family transcriptional regulator